jgi:hypothetical protein
MTIKQTPASARINQMQTDKEFSSKNIKSSSEAVIGRSKVLQ